ncbi:unnamed protein product [Toxocara canis]|uniref:USP8_dimer domain-containing protein n=1 Tax=Toxocara canis TaxID=6265 RepID=A0A183V9I7_TOXCA|nr:unnamed protein product [Toxocara canis]
MVHDSSGVSKRLTELCFNDMAALKAASDLVPRHKLLIERLASVKAFSHVERLFDEASLKQKEGDEEQSYQLLSRMGVISQLIIRKNDFKHFKSTPDGRRFYDLFKICISRMGELEESLCKRYELKEIEKNYRADGHLTESAVSNGVAKETTRTEPKSEFELTIAPRELVRFVEGNRQVLIIDYRDDQSTVIKYENRDRMLVAHVPAEAIVPGCIGTSLIRSAAVSERALLQRMSDVDLVVLLGSQSAPATKQSLRPSSKEHILFNALSTYNTRLLLRRPPVFLKGGFENWQLHYPMHTSNIHAAKRIMFNINDQSEFAKAVAEYKKDICIQSLHYPDLLRRENVASFRQSQTIQPEMPVSDGHAIYPSMELKAQLPPAEPQTPRPSFPPPDVSAAATVPELPSSAEGISKEPEVAAVEPAQPSVPESKVEPTTKDIEPRKESPHDESTVSAPKSVGIPKKVSSGETETAASRFVDRGSTPEETAPSASTRPPVPPIDRSKKPTVRASEVLKQDGEAESNHANLRRAFNSSPNIEKSLPQVTTLGGARIDQTYVTPFSYYCITNAAEPIVVIGRISSLSFHF